MFVNRRLTLSKLFLLYLFLFSNITVADELPPGFVYVDEFSPDIVFDLRYFGEENFIGRPIDGYLMPHCIITREAALALKGVQRDLRHFSFGLKIFDAYRPQQAVDDFVRWAEDLNDTRMKSQYYPNVAKKDLFKLDYIASKSSHSRGSTVDLTIVSNANGNQPVELDMGTIFDFFSPQSWPEDTSVTPTQRANRMLLQLLMEKHGFKSYPNEWWHFTLEKEPYSDTYFDFPIQ